MQVFNSREIFLGKTVLVGDLPGIYPECRRFISAALPSFAAANTVVLALVVCFSSILCRSNCSLRLNGFIVTQLIGLLCLSYLC